MISRVILYGQATMTYHYISINQLNVIIMNWTVFCTQVIKLLTRIANNGSSGGGSVPSNVATKDNTNDINKASQTEDGLMSKKDKKKLDGLKTLTQATSTTLGGVKIGYTTTSKNYAVQLDKNGKMFVNVPWTDTNTTYAAATNSTLGLVKQCAKVTKPVGETPAELKAAIIAIIDNMTTAGQMKA